MEAKRREESSSETGVGESLLGRSTYPHEDVGLLSLWWCSQRNPGAGGPVCTLGSPEIHEAAAVYHNAAIYNNSAEENRGWPFLEDAGAVHSPSL